MKREKVSGKSSIRISEEVRCAGHYDLLVAGAGVAGVAAALAARRRGKKVLLIEKAIVPGGLATIGLINLFVPMCNGRGRQIIRGMAEELLRLSIKYGYDSIPADWKNGEPKQETQQRYMTTYSPQIFALALTELLDSEGVDIRFDSIVSQPVMDGGHCDGVVVESKSGREFFSADMVIDATGDADILFRAGVPTIQGKNYFSYSGHTITLERCRKACESGNIGAVIGRTYGGTANLYGKNHPEGMPFFTGTNAAEISDFLIRNQREMLNRIRGDERLSRDVVTLPGMAQFRTTRCIDGDYVLREEDHYRHFDDSVGAICDFDRRDYLYEIPYRSMICSGYDNLITAGRCVAGEGYAWDVLRVIPPAIISGQAAGTAAAIAIDDGCPIYELEIGKVQKALAANDVAIHFDDSLIPAKEAGDTAFVSEHF